MEQKSLNWKQILVTALLTGTVTIGTGMLLFTLQQREPRLVFEVVDAIPFQGNQETLAIYNVRVRNDGRKVVKEVSCEIAISPAQIRQHRTLVSAPLAYKETPSDSRIGLTIPMLNPREEVAISILAASKGSPPARPKVSLRGEGSVGEEAKSSQRDSMDILSTSFASVGAGMLALVALLHSRGPNPGTKRHFDSEKHHGDQRETLAYLLGLLGRIQDAEAYLRLNREVTYWSEADYLAAKAVRSREKEELESTVELLSDLIRYATMSDVSAGILQYNLARLCKVLGREQGVQEHIEAARQKIPKLLATRFKVDPVFSGSEKVTL